MSYEIELERVLVLAENSESTDALLLAAEVRSLRARLEAVCDVLSDADASDGVVDQEKVMEAVRGLREPEEGWSSFIKFSEIQPGDLLRVSFPPRGGMSDNWTITHSREAYAYRLYEGDWITGDGQCLVSRAHDSAVIERIARLG